MKKEKITVEVTVSELLTVLLNVVIGQFGFIHMVTPVTSFNKTMGTREYPDKTPNPYWGRITKITKGRVLLGNTYGLLVQNKTDNPDFKPEKNRVGDHIGKVVTHNEKTKNTHLQYVWYKEKTPKSEYTIDGGNPIEKELFRSFMTTYTPNKYGVNCQSVCLQNIREIRINRVIYVVKVEVPELVEVV